MFFLLKVLRGSQLEKDKVLSEHRDTHDFFEKKADQAVRGEYAAQTRLSGAQSELDTQELKMQCADRALQESGYPTSFSEEGTLPSNSIH